MILYTVVIVPILMVVTGMQIYVTLKMDLTPFQMSLEEVLFGNSSKEK